jgi:hypothetical protein
MTSPTSLYHDWICFSKTFKNFCELVVMEAKFWPTEKRSRTNVLSHNYRVSSLSITCIVETVIQIDTFYAKLGSHTWNVAKTVLVERIIQCYVIRRTEKKVRTYRGINTIHRIVLKLISREGWEFQDLRHLYEKLTSIKLFSEGNLDVERRLLGQYIYTGPSHRNRIHICTA